MEGKEGFWLGFLCKQRKDFAGERDHPGSTPRSCARLSCCVDSSTSRYILTHRKRNAWSENAS